MEPIVGITSGRIQDQIGPGFEQPDLREYDPNHDRKVVLDDL